MKSLFTSLSMLLCIQIAFSQPRIFNNKIGYFDYNFQTVSQLVDSSGNHYVMGRFNGFKIMFGDTIQSRGDQDIFLLKYNSQNSFEWIRSFGSAALDNPKSMSCDRLGNIYLNGDYSGSVFYASETNTLGYINGYQQSKFLLKVSPSGNTLWASRYSGSTAADDSKSEVFNDHDGRLYFILASRANGLLSSWRYNDSVIANPTNQYINVPRWVLVRVNPNTGQLVWLDYIANPRIGASIISYLYISKPQVDRQNNILFAISYFGTHIDPIYIFGQYAALNSNYNNVLVKLDSLGNVKRFRDLGASNSSKSDVTDLALTAIDEPVLINKRALINTDGFSLDYTQNNNYNFVRIYDTSFVLKRVVRIGDQPISSYLFDKSNRLVTLSTTSSANFGQTPTTETIIIDSISSVSVNAESQIYPYLVRYKNNFLADTFFIERTSKPYIALSVMPNALRISNTGNMTMSIAYPLHNSVALRYDHNFMPRNINYGNLRDLQESILGIGEDSLQNTYVAGIMHLRSDIATAQGDSVYITPPDQSIDIFVAKFDPAGTFVWLRRIGKVGTDNFSGMTIGRDGLYLAISSTSTANWQYDTTSQLFSGRVNLLKVNFSGNLLWQKEITSTNISSLVVSNISLLRNGNLLLAGRSSGQITVGTTVLPAIGSTLSQFVVSLNPSNGLVLSSNRFSLSAESLGYINRFTGGLHEDYAGNLYFGLYTTVTNVNSPSRVTELFSYRQRRVSFNQEWVNQQGILKVDSTLEIKKFTTFRSYFGHNYLAGLGNDIYLTGYARGSSFSYDTLSGLQTVPLHAYAGGGHFVHFTAKFDTLLRINSIIKYDTTSVESSIDINSRKLFVDTARKKIYESAALFIPTRIDSSSTVISNLGGRDLLFLKYDSSGRLMGGVRLGTPQTDNISSGYASSNGLVVASQTVNPSYSSQYLQMQNSYSFRNALSGGQSTSFDFINHRDLSGRLSTIDSSLFVPDNFVSKFRSVSEIGSNPDTLLSIIGDTIFCAGQRVLLKVAAASSIQWYRNNQLIASAVFDSLFVSQSGIYKAVLTTAEGRVASTRTVSITVNANPSDPVVSGVSYCVGSSASALSATSLSGHELLWYGVSSTGGTATTSAPVPSTVSAGVTTYYVSQRSLSTGCESGRSSLVVTVNANPSDPVVSGISYCVGSSASALSATSLSGHELLWYGVSSTGGTATTSAPVPSTVSAGVTTYYVSQRSLSTGCESGRSSLVVTVNANPAKPSISRSASNFLISSAASGNTWYTDGTLINNITTQNYQPVTSGWFTVKSTINGCSSPLSEPYYYLLSPLVNFDQNNFFGFYPNPAKTTIKVAFQLAAAQAIRITIFDEKGRKVLEKNNILNGSEINLIRFNNGLYFMRVMDDKNNLIYTGKLIKN
jgi:hypothetical protein